MSRPFQIPDAGPMVKLSYRLPERSIEALERHAKERGVSVGVLLDRLCERAGLYESLPASSPAPASKATASPPVKSASTIIHHGNDCPEGGTHRVGGIGSSGVVRRCQQCGWRKIGDGQWCEHLD